MITWAIVFLIVRTRPEKIGALLLPGAMIADVFIIALISDGLRS